MSTRLRVGVVGCGMIAQVMHLPNLHLLREHFEIAALCDLSAGTMANLAEYYGVPTEHCVTQWRELIDLPLDAVMVLTAGSHHAPVVLAALEAGRHVFVEKPLCYTLREADAIVQTASAVGKVLMVGNMKRFDPAYQRAQLLVAALSDRRLVQATTLEAPADPYIAHHRFQRVADLSPDVLRQLTAERESLLDEVLGTDVSPVLRRVYPDVLLDSLVHEVNMLRGLLGEPTEVSSAEVWKEWEGLTAVLHFSHEVRCVISWINLPGLAHYSQEIAVYGSDDRVVLRLPSPYLRNAPSTLLVEGTEDGTAVEKSVTVSYQEAFEQELVHFRDCIQTGSTPLTTATSARQDLVVLQAIARAIATGSSQTI